MEGPSSAPCDDFALDGTVVRASTDKLPKAGHIIPCRKVAMLQPPTTWKEGTSDDVASSISEVYGSAKTRLHFKCANSVIFEIFRIFWSRVIFNSGQEKLLKILLYFLFVVSFCSIYCILVVCIFWSIGLLWVTFVHVNIFAFSVLFILTDQNMCIVQSEYLYIPARIWKCCCLKSSLPTHLCLRCWCRTPPTPNLHVLVGWHWWSSGSKCLTFKKGLIVVWL